jgi:zinc/manganese transport system substrate-binding protein
VHGLARPRARWYVAWMLAGSMLAAGCGGGTASGRAEVVATTSILGDLVGPVAEACDLDVAAIMGTGVDPHGFAPSPRDADALASATIAVVNGGGLEESLLDVVDRARDTGTPVFEALGHAEPLRAGDGDDHDDDGADDGDHGHGELDPHFWHDPSRAARAVEAFGAVLGELDRRWAQCAPQAAAERAEQLRDLDEEVAATLAAVPPDRRLLVTDHDSFGYFADRYGFEVVGSVIPSTSSLAQASAGDLAALARTIARLGVPAVFSDASGSRRLVDALAGELPAGVEVVTLHSDALDRDVPSYEELVRTNAQAIAQALTR